MSRIQEHSDIQIFIVFIELTLNKEQHTILHTVMGNIFDEYYIIHKKICFNNIS